MMFKLSVAAAGLALASAADVASSPVAKVIQLLDELKVKVTNDLANEKSQMAEYTEWCDDTITETKYNIEDASRSIEAATAAIEEADGAVTQLSGEIATLGAETAKSEGELNQAAQVRADEASDFKKAESELMESIDTLGRATTIIKRQMSFAQGNSNAAVNKQLQAMEAALTQVIAASWIDAGSASNLKSLLTTSTETEADDELSLKSHMAQPAQATVKNYENHSSGIVETLESLKDTAEDKLHKLQRAEMVSKHNFEMLQQSLKDKLAVLGQSVSDAKKQLAVMQEAKGKGEGDLAAATQLKASEESTLATTSSNCESKAAEWSERQETAAGELAALEKAHEILSGRFASFVQAAAKGRRSNESDETREKVVLALRKLGRTYNSFALTQLANAANADPFVKVRGLIEDMIAKLMQQAAEEADGKAFCDEQIASTKKKQEKVTAALDKTNVRIEKASAGLAQLTQEIAALSKEIADLDKAVGAASKMRSEEAAEFAKASADYKSASSAVSDAMVVLKEFYRSGSFIQTAAKQPEFAESRNDAGHMIIEILETAASDFARLLSEAETTEEAAIAAFKKFKQESTVSRATKVAAVKGKQTESKQLGVSLAHYGEDKQTTSAELEATLAYLDKLKPQCETKVQSYAERKARREAEIEGLKEALDLLSADASFVQKKAFLSKRA